ncbi:MAG: hypothetical protein BGN97_00220 [Microbacterium sp. 69-10]|uniref:hypothetical protein n=1 Tax=Microbacterium sp. 69-10 TaxID=1895783 RepID=UPI00095BB8A2|nr:hypothetical protein [Microbacterium sp. 69-10]OJU39680.1 MAG: hypothetical protein BGN97_00220 [Microbacterium sp. 69-10]
MKHKKLIGGMNTSVILRFSDEAQTYEIFSPWKNGNARPSLKRPVDVVAYGDFIAYTTYVATDARHKSGLGRAAGLGVLFGPAGAIVGAITGRADFDTVNQISVALRTASGDQYILPLLYAPLRGEKSTSTTAKLAMQSLEQVTAKLEATGAAFDPNLSARI